MNPFYNPVFISKILKSYLFDIDRLKRISNEELKKFQDKRFKKMIEFAYTVPVYYEKYREAGVKPDDIRGIRDIDKLPFISKEDIKQYYPDGIVSSNVNRDKLMYELRKLNIGTNLHFYPAHKNIYYLNKYPEVYLPNAEWLMNRIITLPLCTKYNQKDIRFVPLWKWLILK